MNETTLQQDRREPPGNWPGLCRLFVAASVCITCMVPFMSSTSLQRLAFVTEGSDVGWWLLAMICLVSFVSAADSIVNDFLPHRYVFGWAQRNRHLLFLAMAVGVASVSCVNLNEGFLFGNMLRYGSDIIACLTVAALDVFGRLRHYERAGGVTC